MHNLHIAIHFLDSKREAFYLKFKFEERNYLNLLKYSSNTMAVPNPSNKTLGIV